jgi:hypothetical protein
MQPDPDYKTKQQAEILKKHVENPRVSVIRVAAPPDCVVGQMIQGVYAKDETPSLPHKACSRPGGCICSYEPVLDDIYP